jgi:hypothetical protein
MGVRLSGQPFAATVIAAGARALGQILLTDGTLAAPSLAFASAAGSGVWRDSTGVKVSRDGVLGLTAALGQLLVPDGSAALPGLAFASQLNTGVFRPSADAMSFKAGTLTPVTFSQASGSTFLPAVVFGGRFAITPKVVKTANYSISGADTSLVFDGTSLIGTLPNNAVDGYTVLIRNQNASALTIGRNGLLINGVAADLTLAGGASCILQWYGATFWPASGSWARFAS